MLRWLIVLLPLTLVAADRVKPEKPLPDNAHALDLLVKTHPRVELTAARVAAIRELLRRDPQTRKSWDDLIGSADGWTKRPPVAPNADGAATIGSGGACLDAAYSCGLAWHLTGRDEYAQALRANILAACDFPFWDRPAPDASFGMGGANMLHAVAIGYDWLHDRWSKEERAKIRAAIIAKGFKPALRDFGEGGPRSWWVGSYINCTAHNDAALILATLAIGDEEPAIARTVLKLALDDIAIPLATYGPDGVWPEGGSYWFTTTSAATSALAGLETALGTCLRLDRIEGLAATGSFILMTRSPTGIAVGFADGYDRLDLEGMPQLMWLARHYGRPDYARAEIETLARPHQHGTPHDLLWWPDTPPGEAAWPLDARFRGKCDVASMRSGWDRDALFAWIKGGWNEVNHGHLDLGNFELYALGQCWARDLGREDYGLPGAHDYAPHGKRASYFRMGTQGHSVPMLDDQQQNVAGTAQIGEWSEGTASPFAIVELADAYKPAATAAQRGLMLVERHAALVQDEFVLAKPAKFTWGMTTDAQIEVDGPRAILTIAGKRMVAQILEPANAAFTVASGERPKPESENKGVSRLLIEVAPGPDRVRVAVLLAPQWPNGAPAAPTLRPLAEWGKPVKPEKPAKTAKAKRGKAAGEATGADRPGAPPDGVKPDAGATPAEPPATAAGETAPSTPSTPSTTGPGTTAPIGPQDE